MLPVDHETYRVSGHYDCGNERRRGDFLHLGNLEFVNLLEISDDGNLVVALMDEWGEYDGMNVRLLEPFMADFVCRWNDARFCVGHNI